MSAEYNNALCYFRGGSAGDRREFAIVEAHIAAQSALLAELALFLSELPDDLGRGSLNGRLAQLRHRLQDTPK